jgi:alkylation response protein AidB-like acyl-CoA dehydrogenase
MQLAWTAAQEEFRRECASWIRENGPTREQRRADPQASTAHLPPWSQTWIRRQFDAGLLMPGWPAELGGRDASAEEELIYLEELSAAGLDRSTNPQGLAIVGRALPAPRAPWREVRLSRDERAGLGK